MFKQKKSYITNDDDVYLLSKDLERLAKTLEENKDKMKQEDKDAINRMLEQMQMSIDVYFTRKNDKRA